MNPSTGHVERRPDGPGASRRQAVANSTQKFTVWNLNPDGWFCWLYVKMPKS